MKRDISKKYSLVFFLFIILITPALVSAAAEFQVTSFSCSPEEVAISSTFSCTAQIKNNGDTNGTLNVVTLYTDSNNWLENSNYPQAYGSTVNAGESVSLTFSGLRATKSGTNGFSKVMLDSVTDNYISDNEITVNVVNVLVTVELSPSSVSIDGDFDVTAEVTAGGSINVVLNFDGNSGCDLGDQSTQKTITGMTDGSKQERAWSVTQANAPACSFTISAVVTGVGGVASKTNSASESVSCSDCPVEEFGNGGGGGGGTNETTNETLDISGIVANLGDLVIGVEHKVNLGKDEGVSFNFNNEKHILKIKEFNSERVVILIYSDPIEIAINKGKNKKVDLNVDGIADLEITYNGVVNEKAELIITALPQSGEGIVCADGYELINGQCVKKVAGAKKFWTTATTTIVIILFIIAVVMIYFIFRNRVRRNKWK